jgi:GTP pyrophosphokinase
VKEGLQERLLEQYSGKTPLLEATAAKAETLLHELLDDSEIRIHSISSRVKDKESLRRKLLRPGKEYRKLDDVTDLLGLRIITYFPDEVDAVARVIEEEFSVDPVNSIDRRSTLDPDRFGYLSLHYVVTFSRRRVRLPEYRRSARIKIEIQIRSILQHSWAEIEHDLGYKSEGSVPRSIRRRFSRLAGLLEIADTEFAGIRDELITYQETLKANVATAPRAVFIDNESISILVRSNLFVQETDQELAHAANSHLGNWESFERFNANPTAGLPDKMQYVGLETIADVEDALRGEKDILLRFAERWNQIDDEEDQEDPQLIEESDDDAVPDIGFPPGISLFYLAYILVAKTNSVPKVAKYLRDTGIGTGARSDNDIAKDVLRVYREVESSGEDGTIFGLPDTAVQLEIVRSAAAAVRADRVDMLVLTPARGVPESTAHWRSSQFPGAEMFPVMVSKSVPAVRSAPPFQVRWPVAAAKRPVPPMIGPETRYVTTPAVDVV